MENKGVFKPLLRAEVKSCAKQDITLRAQRDRKILFNLREAGNTEEDLEKMGMGAENSPHPSDTEEAEAEETLESKFEVPLQDSNIPFRLIKADVEKQMEKICNNILESMNYRVMMLGIIDKGLMYFHNQSFGPEPEYSD